MAPSVKSSRNPKLSSQTPLTWAEDTELLGLRLELQPAQGSSLYARYTIGLHAWFLKQVQSLDPELSAYLHDGESEKAFTLSGLSGQFSQGKMLQLDPQETYEWTITALSRPVVAWMTRWLQNPPTQIDLKGAPLTIQRWSLLLPPTTYDRLWDSAASSAPNLALSFTSPTSFRRRSHHLPLPYPHNVFHSYLRRWNDFAGDEVDQDEFLDWIDDHVIILRHQLQSMKVLAGKRGAVTGFTGAIEFGLSAQAKRDPDFRHLFLVLGALAPYCGTGHKTALGLGQTQSGWLLPTLPQFSLQDLLAQRIAELTDIFTAQRKRVGGERATKIAETWATVLARREMGESLKTLSEDLEIPYETVKTYAKLARRALKNPEES